MSKEPIPAERPDVIRTVAGATVHVAARPLSAWERFYGNAAARKTVLLALLALAWEVYARVLHNALLFPTFTSTVARPSPRIRFKISA